MRKTLVMMVKEPRAGRVKTRLAGDIGRIPATWWFRHQTRRMIRKLEDPRWDLVLAVSPDAEGMNSRIWPAHLPKFPQGTGDLGDRMSRVFREVGQGPLIIVGGDIPGITPRHIARAFALLGRRDAVLGPAPDGGYWLIGLTRKVAVPPTLLKNVRWSTKDALEDTVASLSGLRIGITDTLNDVDRGADLSA